MRRQKINISFRERDLRNIIGGSEIILKYCSKKCNTNSIERIQTWNPNVNKSQNKILCNTYVCQLKTISRHNSILRRIQWRATAWQAIMHESKHKPKPGRGLAFNRHKDYSINQSIVRRVGIIFKSGRKLYTDKARSINGATCGRRLWEGRPPSINIRLRHNNQLRTAPWRPL